MAFAGAIKHRSRNIGPGSGLDFAIWQRCEARRGARGGLDENAGIALSFLLTPLT